MTENNISLSLFLEKHRSYISAVKQGDNVNELIYIDSTSNPIADNSILDGFNEKGKDEIISILSGLSFKPSAVNIILTIGNFVITRIPYIDIITGDELKELIELEIKHHFEDIDIFSLNCILTPFFDNNRYSDYIYLTLYKRVIQEKLKVLFDGITPNLEIKVSQYAVLNSFTFNYPELNDKQSILFGIEKNTMEISFLSGHKPCFINTREFQDENELVNICKSEFEKIKRDNNAHDYHLFFYGEQLSSELLNRMHSEFMDYPVFRLNAFRRLTTELDKRTREYCSRTAHIYPPCIGAVLPDIIEHIPLSIDENN